MAHTTGLRPDNDTDYGIVGDKTVRTAAQIGNETGQADFDNGPSTGQTLRVILAEGSLVGITPVSNGVNTFNELPAVPIAIETQLVAYIPGVAHFLKRASASGDADATFNLKINGAIVARKRNNWTDRNVVFDFKEAGIPVIAGATIEITVISKGSTACPFDGNLYGEE